MNLRGIKNRFLFLIFFICSISACSNSSESSQNPTPNLTSILETLIIEARAQTATSQAAMIDADQLVETVVPNFPIEGNLPKPKIIHELSSAEVANTGTHIYKTHCDFASGDADKCYCFPDSEGEITFDFSYGVIEFVDIPSYKKIAENTYQHVNNKNGLTATLTFSENGFNWEIRGSDDTGQCTIVNSYKLSGEPIPDPASGNLPINLLKSGFMQVGDTLGYGFLVENPNGELSIAQSQYELLVYNEVGDIIAYKDDGISLLLPGQVLGVGGELMVSNESSVSNIDIILHPGEYINADRVYPFQVESIGYTVYSSRSGYVTGRIVNSTFEEFLDLPVSALVYNSQGDIIGSGKTTINFISGNSSRGVEIHVLHSEDFANYDLYPTLTNLVEQAVEEPPEAGFEVNIVEFGFGQDGSAAGYGMLIKNPSLNYSYAGLRYHVTAYSKEGKVITVDERYINLLLPGQELGVGGYLHTLDSSEVDHIEIRIRAGRYIESEVYPFFSFENIEYQPGQKQVIGDLINPYTSDEVDNLKVYAVAYDEHGRIIGGGSSYDVLDASPNNERLTVGVYLEVAGIPAEIKLFGSITIMSVFE